MLLILSTLLTAQADCPAPTTVSDVDAALAWGEAGVSPSFDGDSAERLSAGAQRAEGALDCLGQPLPADLAARYHRLSGLALFMASPAEATPSFTAARRSEPAGVLPLLPPGHPAQRQLAETSTEATTTPLPEPESGRIQLDGARSLERPDDLPVIAQYFGDDGAVVWSAMLSPGEPVLEYPLKTERSWKLLAAGGGVALSGALYGSAYLLKRHYDGLDPADAVEATGMVAVNHGLVVTSGVLAAGSLGLVVSTQF